MTGDDRTSAALREDAPGEVGRCAALARATGQLIWTTAADGALRDGAAWRAFTGQDPAEATRDGRLAAIHPDDRERVRQAWQQAMAAASPVQSSYRLRRGDGAYREMVVREEPVLDPMGRVHEWVGAAADVTDRVQGAGALWVSSRVVQEASDRAPALDAASDADPEAAMVLAGGGEMGALMRAHDWAATPLGPVARWPRSLRTAVGICLASRFPLLLWWGTDLTMLYNDAYRPILGATKHPIALGQRGRACWPEIWPVIGPMLEGVIAGGEATWSDDQLLLLDRNGYVEECYFTFSYSPIRDESGAVGGVFTAVTETTGRVVGERRLRLLRELSARTAQASSAEDACARAAAALADAPADLPFALLYLIEADGDRAALAGAAGLEPGTAPSPLRLELDAEEETPSGWPLARAARTGQAVVVGDLGARFGGLPGSLGVPAPHAALVLPVAQAGTQRPAALLVAGISPRRTLDDDYRGFLDLVASQSATAIASARASEEERRRATALVELDRAKTAFFSNVSHEFRTPLTLALGPVEEVLTGAGDALSAVHRERLEIAHRNHLRLLKLVNTLLDFARLEAGRARANRQPTDLAALTADLAGVFRSAVERAGLRLVVECPPLPEPVYVDPEMWEKIVLNLLSNAFKFTFEGQIAVTLRRAGEEVALEVRDTGTGIPPHELPHLFERFHRVHGARARTHEGTGIGLALVQELARLHGGDVRAASTLGAGTAFTVTLPLARAHPPDEAAVAPPRGSTTAGAALYVEEALRWLPDGADLPAPSALDTERGMSGGADGAAAAHSAAARILLADDNADMRAYLSHLLAPRYQVRAAADGTEALAVARAWRPDLVLSDLMMPGLDGMALLAALRGDPHTATIPIILLSARAGEEASAEGLDAGADDYLVKPFAARELLARVRTHLEMARLRREAHAALAAERDRLRQVLDALPEGVVIADASGRVEMLNRAGRDLVGFDTRGRPHPRSGDDAYVEYGVRHVDGSPYPAEELPLARSLRHGEVVRGDQELLRQAGTGREIPLLVNSAPLHDADGAIAGAVSLFQDITALRELELGRDEFLGSVAHDLKSPLTAIRAQAQLARRRLARLALPEVAPMASQLDAIESGTARMAGLIDALMDVARLQLGALLQLDRRPTDLVALAGAVIAAHDGTADGILRLEAALPTLVTSADAVRLERVLANLVENAIKYSPEGGEIAVRVAREGEGGDARAVLAVRDRGMGIPAADLPRIFERFYRARNVTGQIRGTGIGLASARQIVEQHGGTLTVESQEGAGSIFTVRLPLGTDAAGVQGDPVASRLSG